MGLFDALNNIFECVQGVDVESVIAQQRKWSFDARIKNAIEGGGYTTSSRIISDIVIYDDDLWSAPPNADFQLTAKGRIIFALKSPATVSKFKFRSVDSRGDRALVVVRAPEIVFSDCIFDGKNSRNAIEADCPVAFQNVIIRNCGAKYNARNVVEVTRKAGGRRRSDVSLCDLKIMRCKTERAVLSVADNLSGTYLADKCVAGNGLFCVGGKTNVSETPA